VRAIGGLAYPPDAGACLALMRPRGGTLAGVQASPAGRLGEGLVIAREPAAVAPARPAGDGFWDGRWRLAGAGPGITVGALGRDRAPGRAALPQRLVCVLPAFRAADGRLLAVPALGCAANPQAGALSALFAPPEPLAGAPFVPAPAPTSA
jgi:tRNA(Ile)-lysidine synthase